MYQYNYKEYENKWWHEIKSLDAFKNVSFPKEELLTTELLENFEITRHEYIPPAPPEPPTPPEPPEPTLEEVKKAKIEELEQSRFEEENKTVTTNKGTFELDINSRERITNAMAVLYNTSDSREWTTADNKIVQMTWNDFNNLYKVAAEISDICFDKFKTLKAMVEECSTVEEVQEINWNIINV